MTAVAALGPVSASVETSMFVVRTVAPSFVSFDRDVNHRMLVAGVLGLVEPHQPGHLSAVTAALHWIDAKPVLGPIRVSHVMRASVAIGHLVSRARNGRL